MVAETCSISADTKEQVIKFPAATPENLATISKDFNIKVEKCTIYNGKVLNLKFNPQQNKVTNDGILKATSASSNVGYKITKKGDDKSVLLSDAPVASLNLNTDGFEHSKVFEYTATYAITDNNPAKIGLVKAVLPFSIEYK
ncbi:fimbrial protein [Ursidibacter arcticus]